jgi:RNA ligase (TIGR02306 family)
MRKLASIRVANQINPIEGADAIEAVRIDGWVCVAKKGEFKVGDKGIYFEIDSFLPSSDERFSFLEKQFVTFDNNKGARLRTIRLRGQLSQGLFLPLDKFPEFTGMEEGADVTEQLNIVKWEPPMPAQLAGEVEGSFPNYLSKSEQERIQNIPRELEGNRGKEYEASIKLDGSSMTVHRNANYMNKAGEVELKTGVCSRNWDLRESESNTMWRVARKNRMLEALEFLNRNLAFQGEIIGEGIQGNPEKIQGHEFYLFDIYDIDKQQYMAPQERQDMVKMLNENGFTIKHVPLLPNIVLNHSVEELLEMADGVSLNPNEKREGLVFKRLDGQFSFKAISNWYLEKHKNR